MTVPATTIARIQQRLRLGGSIRRISRDLADIASRGLIAQVARGERLQREPTTQDDLDKPIDLPPEKCPGCGRMIQMPCRACIAAARLERNHQLRRDIARTEKQATTR